MTQKKWEDLFSSEKLMEQQRQNPFRKLGDMVYDIIESAIISYELQPGTRLNTVKTAELFGISRTPVKEALEQLRKNGFVVTSDAKKGYFVFDISNISLEQLFMARKALEGTAAYLCARQNMLINLEKLKQLAVLFRETFQKKYFIHFSMIDQAFHNLIVTSCGNRYIKSMYGEIERKITYYSVRSQDYMISLGEDPSFAILAGQHIAIYRAIELGMPELAETASKNHLDVCYSLCLRYHTAMNSMVPY